MGVSENYAPNIEELSIRQDNFLNLLELLVRCNFSKLETFNSFIRGFGNNFDDFAVDNAIRFIDLLVQAGLNQVDILDAVIEKFNSSKSNRFARKSQVGKQIFSLVETALEANAAESPALANLLKDESLTKRLGGKDFDEAAKLMLESVSLSSRLALLNKILARVDISQDSALKNIVSYSFSDSPPCVIGNGLPGNGAGGAEQSSKSESFHDCLSSQSRLLAQQAGKARL